MATKTCPSCGTLERHTVRFRRRVALSMIAGAFALGAALSAVVLAVWR
jgi:hypothetical protein